jgi:hypothetical protein
MIAAILVLSSGASGFLLWAVSAHSWLILSFLLFPILLSMGAAGSTIARRVSAAAMAAIAAGGSFMGLCYAPCALLMAIHAFRRPRSRYLKLKL